MACLDRLARERHLGGARSFLLFNCVATYLQLDGRAQELYHALLAEHGNEEKRAMVMTWAEKFEAQAVERGLQKGMEQGIEQGVQKGMQQGLQRGLQQGMQQGMREILLRQLQQRFAPLPASAAQRVSAIDSTEELTRLADKVLSARSLEELGLA
jgi:flagellar biosynthesis/type III secretory pathway protein FliH